MKIDDKEQEYQACLRLRGAPDHATIEALVAAVRDLRNSGQNGKARDLLTNYLSDPAVASSSDLEILRVHFQLGLVYENLGELSKAREVWTSVLNMSDAGHGSGSEFSRRAAINLGNVLCREKLFRDERLLRERVLRSTMSLFGEDSIETSRMLAALATNLDNQGEYAEAYELNRRVVDGFREHQVAQQELITLQWVMAWELLKLGSGRESSELFDAVLMQIAELDRNDPLRRQAQRCKWIYRLAGRILKPK